MDGLHDLGGKQGFGRVKYPSAPHNENWRPLVRALHAFAVESHIYNMDEFRHAIERMTPRHYISAPYFERHLTAIATLLIEKGIASPILCNRRDSARQERVCFRSRSGTRLHSRKDRHDRARLHTNPVPRRSRTQHAG